MSDYINLHTHSHYSILQALPTPKELFARAKELNQDAIAITDYGSMAGVWDSFKLWRATNIKYIAGCEFHFVNDLENKEGKLRYIVLLAKNAIGYKNLLMLHREGFEHSSLILKRVVPIIDWKLLEKYKDGIICLTGCGNGIIGQLINSKLFDEAEIAIKKLIDIFGDNLGAEIQAHNVIANANFFRGAVNQVFTNNQVIRLAKKYNVRIVPTSNTHYIARDEATTHDVMLAIGSGQPVYSNARMKFDSSDLYLKSGDEIKAFFSRNYGDEFAAEICQNTIYFANLCEIPEWIDPKFSNLTGKELPVFPVKDEPDYKEYLEWLSNQTDEIKKLTEGSSFLRYKCFNSFDIYKTKLKPEQINEYIERIERELYVLDHQGFSDYMLITADFLNWARRNNITIGYGRGSGGGTCIGFLLGIHKADPIKYGLIFERFHNIDKKSPPDLDNDIATHGRKDVINYIINKYGKDKTAYVSNLNRIKPKLFVKDVARSCQFGNATKEAVVIGASIAEIIPADLINVIDFEKLKKSALFCEYLKRYPALNDNKKILGKIRNLSSHAAAQIISNRPLVGLVPLRKDKEGNQSIEYDKEDAEENGLLKIDLLGLTTLDKIDRVIDILKKYNKNLTLEDIKFEEYDKKTYDLISNGDTFGVFQFGTSTGTIDLCRKIKPKSIDDLAIITTLARPAAANIRNDFIQTRAGKKQFKLLHPSLKLAFEKTYGFGLYDESILQLGKDVAGWSLNEADRIRKMIKEKGKYPEKEAKLREDFIKSAIKNGIEESMSIKIWEEEIKKFAGYTFNKSHAIIYSFISFVTAYLKAHYPLEFLLTHLQFELQSNAPMAEENADRIKSELRKLNYKILAPHINHSEISYKIQDDNTLLTGMEAAKFLGDDAMAEILEKRPFTSFDDFMLRITSKKVRATSIQALAAIGAMDCFGIPRKLIYLYSSDYRQKLQVWLKKHDPSKEKFLYNWPIEAEWSLPELYALEYKYLGEAFVCGKKEAYYDFFEKKSIPLNIVKRMEDRDFIPSVRAVVKNIFELKVKKETSKYLGQEMLKCVLEDELGEQINATIFPESYKEIKRRIKEAYKNKYTFQPGIAININGTVNIYDEQIGIIIRELLGMAPIPALPKDLKAKKITIKSVKRDEKSNNIDDLMSEIEDDLINNGFLDLDEENREDEEDDENDDI